MILAQEWPKTAKSSWQCPFKDKTYVFISVYSPNKDKDILSFFNNLLATLQRENLDSEDNIIIGGHFNRPLNPEFDKNWTEA